MSVPFISLGNDGKYTINEDAIRYLTNMKGCLNVCAIVGAARTGKSFMCNRIILDDPDAFDVGTSTNSCTKGIFLYKKPIEWENDAGEKINVILLDSEGLCSLDNAINDAKIMGLLFLLSSFLIYNSVGTIDDDAIRKLSLITSITKEIKINQGSDFKAIFPSICWVLRDVALDMKNENDQFIDANQYLENALQPRGVTSEDVAKTNEIREVLRDAFPERMCLAMVRPMFEESDLKKLNSMSFSRMRPVFLEQVEKFRNVLHNKIQPKKFFGNVCNGKIFIEMTKSFVDAINNGAMPNMENSLGLLQQIQDAESFNLALDMYDENLAGIDHVMSPDKITEQLRTWKREAIAFFKQSCKDKKSSYLSKLEKQLQVKIDSFSNQNTSKLKLTLMEYTNQMQDIIHDKLPMNQVCDTILKTMQTITDQVYVDFGKTEAMENMWCTVCVGFLSRQIGKLSQLIISHQSEVPDFLKKIDNLNSKIQELNESAQTNQLNIQQTTLAIEQIEIQKQELIEKSQEFQIQLQESERQLHVSKLEYAQLNQMHDAQTLQINSNATIHIELEEARQNVERLNSQVDQLKSNICLNEEKFIQFLDHTKQEAISKNKKLKEFQTIAEQESKKSKLQEENHITQLQALQNKITDLEQQVKSNEARVAQEIKSKSALEVVCEELKSQSEQIMKTGQTEIKLLQSQYLEFQTKSNTKIRELETKLACGNVEMTNCKRRLADCEEDASNSKRFKFEAQKLQSDLDAQKNILGYLEKDKIQKDLQVATLREQNSKLDEKLAICKRDREMDLLKYQMANAYQ